MRIGMTTYLKFASSGIVISADELAQRRAAMDAKGAQAWKPVKRERYVSAALQAYALLTTSADTGAVRDITQIQR